MEWLTENWPWILFGILFAGMHMFGHGSHGRHGSVHDVRHRHGGNDAGNGENPASGDSDDSSRHQY